jgi:hypothetical protein
VGYDNIINNTITTEKIVANRNIDTLFQSDTDYWAVAETIKDIYMSDGSLTTLLDFEGVLDEVNLYAFKNWFLGELVEGPEISRYSVTCTFLWSAHLMPDPRGAKRLLPFDCTVRFKKTKMKVPVKIESPDDYREGTKKPVLKSVPVWLVEITMPKSLIADIRSGSIELEGQEIELADLDLGYEEDLDQAAVLDNNEEEVADEATYQDELAANPFA